MADKTSMNVKEMIQAGISPDDMIKQLQNEIKTAQDEIAAEKKSAKAASNDEIAEARSAVIDNCVNYLTLIGVLDEEIPDSDIKELKEMLEEIEKKMDKMKPVFSALREADHDDIIIRTFLRSL